MTDVDHRPALDHSLPPPPATPRQLTDGGAVALAVATCMGAWWQAGPPLAMAVVVAVGALVARLPVVLVVAGLLLGGALGARSADGLTPVGAGSFDGVVTLVGDPRRSAFGTQADVRIGRDRVVLRANGAAAGALDASLTGERVRVSGRLTPPAPGTDWMVPRHLVGTLQADHAERVDSGSAPWRGANRFRRLLDRGARNLPDTERSLYTGFVLGDGRNQPPEIIDDFRGAGMTHLLVVSGQNVAFVLVLVSPLIARLGWRGRWLATMGVIVAFGVVTRFEPSVLRASAMAALAVTSRAVGRPSPSLRTLALAVTGLVIIDPLLVRSIAFQLSAGASLAIALLAQPIARLVPGPRLVADALGVTLAAQAGVAPILIPRFGGIPVASIPANLLAVPISGLITSYGLPAGVVAGMLGDVAARWVHLPTTAMLAWVAGVARWAAAAPLGQFGVGHAVAFTGCLVVMALGRWAPLRVVACGLALMVAAAPSMALREVPLRVQLDGDGVVHRSNGVTIVEAAGRGSIEATMGALRVAGVRRIDVLVASGSAVDLAAALRHRWTVARIIDGSTPPQRVPVGPFTVVVTGGSAPPQVVHQPP